MNLKRQLLLVSLLALMLPWAGCEFIRETESALRSSQQQMLSGTARAIADAIAQYPEEFPATRAADFVYGDQLFGHSLEVRPEIDGYVDDWAIDEASLRVLRGSDGPIRFVIGMHEQFAYLYAAVRDRNIVFAGGRRLLFDGRHADGVAILSASPPYLEERFEFAAEAPGQILPYVMTADGPAPEPRILAHWQDVPGGYQLEARIPVNMLGTHLGLIVRNTDDASDPGVLSASFSSRLPGAFVTAIPELTALAQGLVARGSGMRLIVTDASGWRLANVGKLAATPRGDARAGGLLRIAYDALVEPGQAAAFADPDPAGREQQDYVRTALQGEESASWFRSEDSGRAVVAVAAPVESADATIGAVILQQGTEAILSLTNRGLARLMNLTVIATLFVAGGLLGYATWLSRRIRRLSVAAEMALETDDLRRDLPSAQSGDEIGDLSRSFSSVLRQLGEYNEYLRTLASKLSHELRTPLTIVTSSLENLEHEPLSVTSAGYAARARDGAERLRRILSAMSEASRVEELMMQAEPEHFDLVRVLDSTIAAYRDAYPERDFEFVNTLEEAPMNGAPELLIQMLDKLVDNAVGFSSTHDTITIALVDADNDYALSVSNPGPPLPERMRTQLFDSMVSVRGGADDKHLGLGLYVARLVAEGHGGRIAAENIDGGVRFTVYLLVS
jgi:dedicated sortase system histidine kinase